MDLSNSSLLTTGASKSIIHAAGREIQLGRTVCVAGLGVRNEMPFKTGSLLPSRLFVPSQGSQKNRCLSVKDIGCSFINVANQGHAKRECRRVNYHFLREKSQATLSVEVFSIHLV